MSAHILPLPKKNNLGHCPWCNERLCDAAYETGCEDDIDDDVVSLQDGGLCPKCGKPIVVTTENERTVFSYDVVISPARTATDKRYMELMGVRDE